MTLAKDITDKKVNFEFNKEFINLFSKKIKDNDTDFLNRTLKELHPADSADIIENLLPESRSKLIELEGFNLDPEIFIELNESIQTEIFILLSTESIVNILKRLESDNALKILENLDESKKNTVFFFFSSKFSKIFNALSDSKRFNIFAIDSIDKIINISACIDSFNSIKISGSRLKPSNSISFDLFSGTKFSIMSAESEG